MWNRKFERSNYIAFSDIYRINKLLNNFQEFLNNLFEPLFQVSINPHSNLELHKFLTVTLTFLGI